MTGWRSQHLVVAHPSDPEWETCRACLAPVLAELAVSQAEDVDGIESSATLAIKERWQALFWRARTWSSRRKHLSSCSLQSAETRRMAKSLLDANADSNRKAAAQREDKRRKPGEAAGAEAIAVGPTGAGGARRARVKGAGGGAAGGGSKQQQQQQQQQHLATLSASAPTPLGMRSASFSSSSSSSGDRSPYSTGATAMGQMDNDVNNSNSGNVSGVSLMSQDSAMLQHAESDIDAGDNLDIDLDLDPEPESSYVAQPHLLHPRYTYSYPAATAGSASASTSSASVATPELHLAGTSEPAQSSSTSSKARSASGRVRSLPTWHSSHLVSKHPLKYNLETCAACLSSFEREKLEIMQNTSLVPLQRERRIVEIDSAIRESYWNSKRVYARNRHLQQCPLQTPDTQQKAASRYSSHLERHRMYSRNWAEKARPGGAAAARRKSSTAAIHEDDAEDGIDMDTEEQDADGGASSEYEGPSASEAGENDDSSVFRYGESYSSTGYTLDALTAAAQEAANDYSWELSSSSSPVRPDAMRSSSEDVPPLTPDAFGPRQTPKSDAESLPPASYVPPCIWQVIEVEDKLVKASVMRSTSLSLDDRNEEDDDDGESFYSSSVPNALGWNPYSHPHPHRRPQFASHRREESTASVAWEADTAHLAVQFKNSMLGSPDFRFKELKPRSLGQPQSMPS